MPDPSNPDAHPIDLLVSDQIRDLLFKFLIHEENIQYTVHFRFDYSFTQNQGLENE